MSFKELHIKASYTNLGDEPFVDSFLLPALEHAKLYQRSVGFFSSTVLKVVAIGVKTMANNGGKIQLIASPKLTEEDSNAIEIGYESKKSKMLGLCSNDFSESIELLGDENLIMLADLISNGILDIKIAFCKGNGIYHDKFGIMQDYFGNIIAFSGSANSTFSGYQLNYEKIRLVKSWNNSESESEVIQDEQNEFSTLWNNKNPFVEVCEYTQVAYDQIKKLLIKRKEVENNIKPKKIELRDYQQAAIDAWIANGYRGFFVMATGTGKTWTAIYAAKNFLDTHKALLVILAPYKHLIKQWEENVRSLFENSQIILYTGEHPKKVEQFRNAIIGQKYSANIQIIVICTIKSFYTDKFQSIVKISQQEKLLIVDEAHRFVKREEWLKSLFPYRLGLSATPCNNYLNTMGNDLVSFFGGQVFSLTIEDALKLGYLAPYEYHPVIVASTEEEELKFEKCHKRVLSCFYDGKLVVPVEELQQRLRARLRVIAMVSGKLDALSEILKNNEIVKDHMIVYCGDGKLRDNVQREIRHLEMVQKILSRLGLKSSKFTAEEDINERMTLINNFNENYIDSLVAIRCLDEGIDIPSIKTALVLASNDSNREFIQRRGRILRLYTGKKFAQIYDFIALPSIPIQPWAKIELKRFYEYGHLATNWEELKPILNDLLEQYALAENDVKVYEANEEMEEPNDE